MICVKISHKDNNSDLFEVVFRPNNVMGFDVFNKIFGGEKKNHYLCGRKIHGRQVSPRVMGKLIINF